MKYAAKLATRTKAYYDKKRAEGKILLDKVLHQAKRVKSAVHGMADEAADQGNYRVPLTPGRFPLLFQAMDDYITTDAFGTKKLEDALSRLFEVETEYKRDAIFLSWYEQDDADKSE